MKRPPSWLLYALIPILLACAFVGGVAYKTYRGNAPALDPPPAVTETKPPVPATGAPVSPPAVPPTPTTPPAQPAAPVSPGVKPSSPPPASGTVVDPPVSGNVALALSTLRSDYMSMVVDGARVSVAGYHVLPGTGMNKQMIAGWISVDQYPAWDRALKSRPSYVQAWMTNAANAVKPYAGDFAFELSWAVVDIVTGRPKGFTSYEISSRGDGRYLVVRPLAATGFLYSRYEKASVSLRPWDAYGPAPGAGLWATYGPNLDMLAGMLYLPEPPKETGPVVWSFSPWSAASHIKAAAASLNKIGKDVEIAGTRLPVREYQPLPLARETLVGGLITLADYPAWQAAIDNQPEAVAEWVGKMVEGVRPGPNDKPFRILWTVVDVVRTQPPGFAKNELTPVTGGWLVTRPLIIAAANPGDTQLAFEMRSVDVRYTLPDSAWNTYRPAIYFDAKSQTVVPAK